MGAKIVEDPAFRDRVSVFSDRFEAGSLLAGKLQSMPIMKVRYFGYSCWWGSRWLYCREGAWRYGGCGSG
jgi:hypothetical protein